MGCLTPDLPFPDFPSFSFILWVIRISVKVFFNKKLFFFRTVRPRLPVPVVLSGSWDLTQNGGLSAFMRQKFNQERRFLGVVASIKSAGGGKAKKYL